MGSPHLTVAIPTVFVLHSGQISQIRASWVEHPSTVLEVPGSNLPSADGGRPLPEYEGLDGLRIFREDLNGWLDANRGELLVRGERSSLADEVVRSRRNQRLLWDAGWLRCGWPQSLADPRDRRF